MRVVLSQVKATAHVGPHTTHPWDAGCPCHPGAATVYVVLRRPKVKVALIALTGSHLVWSEILMLVVIGLVFSDLLRHLVLVLSHGTSCHIIGVHLMGHFNAVSLILDRPHVVADVADAVPKLAQVELLKLMIELPVHLVVAAHLIDLGVQVIVELAHVDALVQEVLSFQLVVIDADGLAVGSLTRGRVMPGVASSLTI